MPLRGPEPSLFPENVLTPDVQSEGLEQGLQWWAMYTLSRREKELMRRLNSQRIGFFAPIVPRRYRSPAGRQRTSYLPLFTNYVFVFGTPTQRYEAVASGCVSRCLDVGDPRGFAADLRRIHQMIASGEAVTPESRIEPGTRVRIKSGSLLGLEGEVFQRRGQSRLLVVVNFLQQGASVELGDWEVERL